MLADEGYGTSPELREGCRKLHLDYAVSVSNTTRVWVVDAGLVGDRRLFRLDLRTGASTAGIPRGSSFSCARVSLFSSRLLGSSEEV